MRQYRAEGSPTQTLSIPSLPFVRWLVLMVSSGLRSCQFSHVYAWDPAAAAAAAAPFSSMSQDSVWSVSAAVVARMVCCEERSEMDRVSPLMATMSSYRRLFRWTTGFNRKRKNQIFTSLPDKELVTVEFTLGQRTTNTIQSGWINNKNI